MTDLSQPYQPVLISYEEQDAIEYVTRDGPTVAKPIDGRFHLLLDMATREPIGFRLEHPGLGPLCKP